MKAGGYFFGVLTLFFGTVAVIYWIFSNEHAGTVALALTGGLCLLVAFYLLFTARRLPPLPEDKLEAEVYEGAGEVGFYSPHSWMPLALGAAVAVLFLGLVFGWWLFAIGAVLVALATIGFVFEYYRADAY
ncbi:MAG TPA: cytochrome c oxidase subunit 4 [Actinomycetes bacterium]|nr:cytochrome c oxidase subunit 4 [Actinomycetes bacterium]